MVGILEAEVVVGLPSDEFSTSLLIVVACGRRWEVKEKVGV